MLAISLNVDNPENVIKQRFIQLGRVSSQNSTPQAAFQVTVSISHRTGGVFALHVLCHVALQPGLPAT